MYIKSLKKSNDLMKDELRVSEERCDEAKRQLREANDHQIATEARQRMLLHLSDKIGKNYIYVNTYFCPKCANVHACVSRT